MIEALEHVNGGPLDPDKAQAVRVALERIANKIETRAGNKTYRAAWKIAAKIVRDSKPD